MSTISEESFQHVQGSTCRDLWLAREHAYVPHTSLSEWRFKTQLLKIQMKGDETSAAYFSRVQKHANALANIGQPMSKKGIFMLMGDFQPSGKIHHCLSCFITHGYQPMVSRQLNVQNAFLHGDLKKNVSCVSTLQVLVRSQTGTERLVSRIFSALISLGFRGSKTNPSLFFYSIHGTVMYILVYVDDIILTDNNNKVINYVVHRVGPSFAVQDMGSLSYFMGCVELPILFYLNENA
ncbi:hypothetical protein OSB04_012680 [Centaurea solstitialis]|uniref:Reverse transcriptase Ty1/copia-type domain-containing protein n=1 Tax=Centaurea solstitialis TaxID=347529 RepID=A0AA38WQT3_9ASTR|nr:hypothetical protein OSB04_012680 [Centaurea solstitialis]